MTLAMTLAGLSTAAGQGYGRVPDMPQSSDPRLNPTGPSPTLPPSAVAPMPPSRDFRTNPTGPQAGAPPGYIHPMPRSRGRYNATGPSPQRPDDDLGVSREPSPRRSPSGYSGGKAEVGRGLESCLDGYSAKRGLTRAEHRALCNKIWKNQNSGG